MALFPRAVDPDVVDRVWERLADLAPAVIDSWTVRQVQDYILHDWNAGRDWTWDSEATGGFIQLEK